MPTGLNWTAFAMRFQDAIEAKGLWGYFDGTAVCPVLSKPPKPEEELALTQWIKEDRSAKALLTHRIPDSTLIWIHGKKSLKDQWDLISKEFSSKGAFAQADLRTQFMESKCPDKGNVCEFMDELCLKKEELATYSVVIEEKDYRSTIIKSLLPHLSAFASNLLAGARLYSSTKTIDPDELISLVSEEYERHAAQRLRCTGGNTSKGNDKDEAMFASPNGKGKRPERRPRGICWNCGDNGHYKDKCPKPAKLSANKSGSQNSNGTVNVAVESGSKTECAFMADELWDSDSELPPLLSTIDLDLDIESTGDGKGDWFSEVSDNSDSECEMEQLPGTDESDGFSLVSSDSDRIGTDLEDAHAVCVKVEEAAGTSPCVKVYDSGCTTHITPYQDTVQNFVKISPKSFQAANKQSFMAVGMGEMTIDIPNNVDISKLRLTEVLYHPKSATHLCRSDGSMMPVLM
jgi:gag-polypeptide of LTR copia-type/Pol polyprotein, beta-barrel domain